MCVHLWVAAHCQESQATASLHMLYTLYIPHSSFNITILQIRKLRLREV